ncbi:MAG TPA: hypothetical protein VG942_12270 [Hyphomonadaceae bacterium]|nr:hypothetical protein [Hyphomonadaceae bacterium]
MRLLKISITALALAALASPALAQVPKTPDGHPDLNGVWTNASLTPLSRAQGVKSLVVSEAEAQKIANGTSIAGIPANDPDFNRNARYSDPTKGAPQKGGADFGLKGYDSFWVTPGTMLAKVKGEYRTSNIVDPPNGQLPFKDPAGQAKKSMAGFQRYLTGNAPYEGPEEPALSERCLIGFGTTGGPGMLSVLYNNNYQFVLTKDYLMILVEMAHDARIIPLFASASEARAHHKPNVIKPWLGDSVGWWEGDTLVMETTNLNPEQSEENSFPLSPTGVVTERLTRTGEKDIFYEFTVNDPVNYTQPWKAELSFYPQSRVYEYACHEGNYGIVGMLRGARLRDAQAAAAAKTQTKPVSAPAKTSKPTKTQ